MNFAQLNKLKHNHSELGGRGRQIGSYTYIYIYICIRTDLPPTCVGLLEAGGRSVDRLDPCLGESCEFISKKCAKYL